MLSKARSPIFAMALATVFTGCTVPNTAQQPQNNAADPTNASYSMIVDSGVLMSPQEAAAAHCDPNQEMCTTPTKVEDTLTLSTLDDGDLAFDVMVNAFNGHSCSAKGVASKTSIPHIWRFEQNNDGATCRFNISIENGAVTLKQDADSDCSSYCGARAYLGGTFPFSSIKQ